MSRIKIIYLSFTVQTPCGPDPVMSDIIEIKKPDCFFEKRNKMIKKFFKTEIAKNIYGFDNKNLEKNKNLKVIGVYCKSTRDEYVFEQEYILKCRIAYRKKLLFREKI